MIFLTIISFIGTFLVFLIIMFNKIFRKQKLSVASIIFIILSVSCFIFIGRILNDLMHEPVAKPVIYLYPSNKTEVSVNLGNSDKITCSYPKYKNNWNVIANPDGNLLDLDTGLNLYSLYYESDSVVKFKVENEGFCVKGEDTTKFLENTLSTLGLNYKEKEEFIIYWLPKLEKNKYNYIRFATDDEISKNMPLNISPSPDTLIRVLMIYKPLNHSISTKEQHFSQKERNGFTVVEWGGTEIK